MKYRVNCYHDNKEQYLGNEPHDESPIDAIYDLAASYSKN